jgi:hypothetical protein
MARPPYGAVSAEELSEIARRAHEALSFSDEEEQEYGHDVSNRVIAAINALRFVAAAAPIFGATHLLPTLTRATTAVSGQGFESLRMEDLLAQGLERSIRGFTEVTPALVALAREPKAEFRASLARSLRPFDDDARRLLSGLASDPVPEVRRPARARLGEVVALPEWWGLFQDDPFEGLADDRAEALSGALARAYEIWNRPRYRLPPAEELVAVMVALPDQVALPLLEHILLREDLNAHQIDALVQQILLRPGSEEALARLCRGWPGIDPGLRRQEQVVALRDQISAELRERLCRLLLAFLAEDQPEGDRPGRRDPRTCEEHAAAKLLEALWPAELSPRPVLELSLGCPLEEASETPVRADRRYAYRDLDALFRRSDLNLAPILPLVLEARSAGYPGAWGATPHSLKNRVDQIAAPWTRERALELLEGGTADEQQGAMFYLVGKGHDPETDPSVGELLVRFYRNPATRASLFEHRGLLTKLLPRCRTDLREDHLSFHEALSVLFLVDDFWEGLASSNRDEDGLGSAGDRRRAERREALDEWLGPEELRGPITAEEWEIYRQRRLAEAWRVVPISEAYPWKPFGALPPGPWHSEDLTYVRRVVGRWKEELKPGCSAMFMALREKPAPETDELLTEVVEKAVSTGEDLDLVACLNELKYYRLPERAAELVRQASGLEVALPVGSAGLEWMDDEE